MQTTRQAKQITVKQVPFLQKLITERAGNPEVEAMRVVANHMFKIRNFPCATAIQMISDLLEIPKNEWKNLENVHGTVTVSADPIPNDLISNRIYVNAKGQIVKAIKGKSGRFYAKVRVPGGWDYLPHGLAGARPLTAEEAASFGHEHDRCVFCFLPLSDDGPDRSVHVGYGPVCAKKYGLPWG